MKTLPRTHGQKKNRRTRAVEHFTTVLYGVWYFEVSCKKRSSQTFGCLVKIRHNATPCRTILEGANTSLQVAAYAWLLGAEILSAENEKPVPTLRVQGIKTNVSRNMLSFLQYSRYFRPAQRVYSHNQATGACHSCNPGPKLRRLCVLTSAIDLLCAKKSRRPPEESRGLRYPVSRNQYRVLFFSLLFSLSFFFVTFSTKGTYSEVIVSCKSNCVGLSEVPDRTQSVVLPVFVGYPVPGEIVS